MYIEEPNINGLTQEEQLSQIRSYLYKINEQLNTSLNDIETKLQGFSGIITTRNGERLTFENGTLKSKE